MDSRKLNFFEKIIISIWKFNKYSLLMNQKLLETIKMFTIISILQIIIISTTIVTFGNKTIFNNIDKSINEIPEFSIQNNEIDIELDETVIYADVNNILFAFLDSNINTNDMLIKYANVIQKNSTAIMIARDAVTIKRDDDINSYKYEKLTNLGITDKPSLIEKYNNVFKKDILPIAYFTISVIVFIVTLGIKLLGGYILIPVARYMAKKKELNLTKLQAYNIAMYSGMFETLVSMLILSVSIILPFWTIIKIGLILIFMHYGIKEIAKQK